MFRSWSSIRKLALGVSGAAGIQLGAAAVVEKTDDKPKFNLAESDKRLKKKPEWYQFAVHELETLIRKFSSYGFIEHEELTSNAILWFERCADSNNPEILWRLARAYIEKSKLDIVDNRVHYPEHRDVLLQKAYEAIKKALAQEPPQGSAGAHKWYAIILQSYIELHPFTAGRKGTALAKQLAPSDGDVKSEIRAHLNRAAEIDPKDPFTWHLLGIEYFELKDYKKAGEYFQKAEDVKPDFSSANRYYLGRVYMANKEIAKAKEAFLKTLSSTPKNKADGRAKSMSKQHLVFDLKLKADEVALLGQEDWKYQPELIYDETIKF
uniref:Regulator of microtubule dynamics protein 1 n=1 Tax=Acrobeloides nanus TaxID=290746 RepID=A0A914E272_9BILA